MQSPCPSLLATSFLALSLLILPTSGSTETQQQKHIPTLQTNVDRPSTQLNNTIKRAYTVGRRLRNLNENLQLHRVNRSYLQPSIQKEQASLTQVSTQLHVLEEKLSEGQWELDGLLKEAKVAKNTGLVETVTALNSNLERQSRRLAKNKEEIQQLLSDTQELLKTPTSQIVANASVVPSKIPPVRPSTDILSQKIGKSEVTPPDTLHKPTVLSASATKPTHVPTPITKVADTSPVDKVKGTTIAKAVVPPTPPTKAKSAPRPQGNIPLAVAATLPERIEAQRALLLSQPKEVTSAELEKLEAELKTQAKPHTLPLMPSHKIRPVAASGDKNAPVISAVGEEQPNASRTQINKTSGKKQVLVEALPALKDVEKTPQEALMTEAKKPLRTLGQPETTEIVKVSGDPLAPTEEFTNTDGVPAVPEQIFTADTETPMKPQNTTFAHGTKGNYKVPPLAVLFLDEGASSFKWYAFTAINRGLYKNPDMEFDIVEYSEDTSASGAKEVEGLLLTLGIESSKLHTKHAAADDRKPRIQIHTAEE